MAVKTYASASGNMHGKLADRTFHNAELELNSDFIVYITCIFCVQIIDFRAVSSMHVYALHGIQFKPREL